MCRWDIPDRWHAVITIRMWLGPKKNRPKHFVSSKKFASHYIAPASNDDEDNDFTYIANEELFILKIFLKWDFY